MGFLLPLPVHNITQHPPLLSSSISHHSLVINPTRHTSFSTSSSSSSSQFHLLRSSFLGFPSRTPLNRFCRRQASSNPGPPSPEQSDSTEDDSAPIIGIEEALSKFQDQAQIFFAVLFWMSLFFWACATDGGNDDRPSKRSRFRR